MSNTLEAIETRLQQHFSPQTLHVEDESWKHAGHAAAKAHGGGHYRVAIDAAPLNDLPRARAHRLIYQALGDLFPAEIHALSIQIGAGSHHKQP